MQGNEASLKAFCLQIGELALGGVKGMGIYTSGLQGCQDTSA
jgi:hypothetical protein